MHLNLYMIGSSWNKISLLFSQKLSII